MKELYEKLRKIQMELKAPKGQYNNFGKYNYRSCEDILEAVKPLLDKYGLLLQLYDDLVYMGERYYIKAIARIIDGDNFIETQSYAREEETKKGMDGSQITGASSSYARKYALNGLFLIDDTKDSDTTNVGEEITEEQAKEFRFAETSKAPNKTILEVYKDDPKYLQWWLDFGKDARIKTMIQLLTDLTPADVPETKEEQEEKLLLTEKMNKLVHETNTNYPTLLKHYKVDSTSKMTLEQIKDAIKKLEGKL